MLKGLALTPPIVGRISIGKVVERAGKRLPEKDDEFTLTSQVQSHGAWVPHPLDEALRQPLRQAQGAGVGTGQERGTDRAVKLRSIPVRLLFDDPDLNLRSAYTLFDRLSGRPLCVGNGEVCKRATVDGIQSLPCPAPEGCEMAQGRCKPFGRLNVQVGGEDDLGSFVFRTTGFNSIRTLATRLRYFAAVSGGCLSTLALELRLRGKSTTQSHRAPIYYVDLTVRSGHTLAEAITEARAMWEQRQASGFDQAALDAMARASLALGAFEESLEDTPAILEEFFPAEDGVTGTTARARNRPTARRPAGEPLGDRLARRAEDAGLRVGDAA